MPRRAGSGCSCRSTASSCGGAGMRRGAWSASPASGGSTPGPRPRTRWRSRSEAHLKGTLPPRASDVVHRGPMDDAPEMTGLLDRFAGQTVAVIGDVMLDRYWWGGAARLSPEAPVPVIRMERITESPGGAANVAANVAGLGGMARLVGLIGDDDTGRALRGALKAS